MSWQTVCICLSAGRETVFTGGLCRDDVRTVAEGSDAAQRKDNGNISRGDSWRKSITTGCGPDADSSVRFRFTDTRVNVDPVFAGRHTRPDIRGTDLNAGNTAACFADRHNCPDIRGTCSVYGKCRCLFC